MLHEGTTIVFESLEGTAVAERAGSLAATESVDLQALEDYANTTLPSQDERFPAAASDYDQKFAAFQSEI